MSNRSKFANLIAERLDTTKKDGNELLMTITEVLRDHLNSEGEAVFPGLGRLKLVTRQARRGHNPKTGEAIDIPAKTVVKVKVFPGGLD
jgi:DNA-binding protein HU-beta